MAKEIDYWATVLEYQIQIDWQYDENEEDILVGVHVFCYKVGGLCGFGKTAEEAVKACLEDNKLKPIYKT